MLPRRRIVLREEQLYVVAIDDDRFVFQGERMDHVPWHALSGSHLFASTVDALEAMLSDAVVQGYQILEGYSSDRRSLRGFTVGLGAWGWRGHIECRTLDTWCLAFSEDEEPLEATYDAQARLRRLCVRLNAEEITFRPSAFRWLSSLYTKMGAPAEPEGRPDPLPPDVDAFCRMAHVGGPVVHARTSLKPFVSLDRDRAFGSAMLEPLPCGQPAEVSLSGNGLARWRPQDLMGLIGFARAVVQIRGGQCVPLLPLVRHEERFDRARTFYATGTLKGIWCLSELAYLEKSGRGHVESFERVVLFEGRPVLRAPVLYMRGLEGDLPIPVKRLEHLLYGKCAVGRKITRIASVRGGRQPLLRDVLDDRALSRVSGRAQIRTQPLAHTKGRSRHPLVRLSAMVGAPVDRGAVDRPDRSAWITSTNRREICSLIDLLDVALQSGRSAEYVGRIYVDGLDIEAPLDRVPALPGASVRRSGPWMRLYRANALSCELDDGTRMVEGVGRGAATEEELIEMLAMIPDPDGGPLASGRIWDWRESEMDPRLRPARRSEPPHVDLPFVEAAGFFSTR